MSDDTSSHVRVSHLYDELLYLIVKMSFFTYTVADLAAASALLLTGYLHDLEPNTNDCFSITRFV